LEIIFPDPTIADGWVRSPAYIPPFGGKTPLRYMLRGDMAARTIGRDELEHAGLFLRVRIGAGLCRGDARMAVEFLHRFDARDRIRMRHVAGFAALESVKITAPCRRHRCGIAQVRFVQILDERGVAAG